LAKSFHGKEKSRGKIPELRVFDEGVEEEPPVSGPRATVERLLAAATVFVIVVVVASVFVCVVVFFAEFKPTTAEPLQGGVGLEAEPSGLEKRFRLCVRFRLHFLAASPLVAASPFAQCDQPCVITPFSIR
jgi:hypothetical protein